MLFGKIPMPLHNQDLVQIGLDYGGSIVFITRHLIVAYDHAHRFSKKSHDLGPVYMEVGDRR